MEIKIHNPHDLPTINYEELLELQGDLKTLSEENFNRLKNSLEKYGFRVPVFVWWKHDEESGDKKPFILDGHQRKIVLSVLQCTPKEIPYVPIHADDYDEAKRMLLMITSNFGTMTEEGFKNFTKDMEDDWLQDFTYFDAVNPILDMGGDDQEKGGDDNFKANHVLPEESITKEGDIYTLNNHRLLCGDATFKEHVENLCQGYEIQLMVTDPAYGVEYNPNWREERFGSMYRSLGKVIADEHKPNGKPVNSSEDEDNKIFPWDDAIRHYSGNVAYVWHASYYTAETAALLKSLGYQIINQIIWYKKQFVVSRGDYHWQHEPLWYCVKKGKKHNWNGDRKQTTVWDIDINSFTNPQREETYGHSTQKPLECMYRPIINNSKPGDNIYDPFLGSGTTLIACEKSNRVCFGMEINEFYCDIIVHRFIRYMVNSREPFEITRNGQPLTDEEIRSFIEYFDSNEKAKEPETENK